MTSVFSSPVYGLLMFWAVFTILFLLVWSSIRIFRQDDRMPRLDVFFCKQCTHSIEDHHLMRKNGEYVLRCFANSICRCEQI